MRFIYRLTEDATGWQATTEPLGEVGRGDSPAAAVLDLREVLTLRFNRPGGLPLRSGIGNTTIDLEPMGEELPGHLLDEPEESVRPTRPEPAPGSQGGQRVAGAAAMRGAERDDS
jgi:hypothetical protein